MQIIKAVPTNIITGALGVGKTTLIKQILNAKPPEERWAVLVNEFGEVGIDGALLTSAFKKQITENHSVFLREIPGGCMCCASGLPIQIALNQLISIAKPHRLLIEPTGLGHPKELIEVLSSVHYRDVIALNTTLCLTDARKLNDPKWRAHKTFQEQFQIADIIVASKHDLYSQSDHAQLENYLKDIEVHDTPVINAEKGKIGESMLNMLSQNSKNKLGAKTNVFEQPLRQGLNSEYYETDGQVSTNTVIKKENSGDGFFSHGWIWPANYCFDHLQLIDVFHTIDITRIKAVMITNKGIFGFNGHGNELQISEYDEALDSRLEIIADSEVAAKKAASAIEKALTIDGI